MATRELQEADFLKDVREHEIQVLRDDGEHGRHLRFAKPGTGIMSFDIITWPGHLAFTGDMGTYVFARLPDMFQFFRDDGAGALRINPGYWKEKVLSVDRHRGLTEWDPDACRQALLERVKAEEDEGAPVQNLKAAVREELLSHLDDDDERSMRERISSFDYNGFTFDDFWEVTCQRYTVGYLWCCYALPWAVRQYDAVQPARPSLAAPGR